LAPFLAQSSLFRFLSFSPTYGGTVCRASSSPSFMATWPRVPLSQWDVLFSLHLPGPPPSPTGVCPTGISSVPFPPFVRGIIDLLLCFGTPLFRGNFIFFFRLCATPDAAGRLLFLLTFTPSAALYFFPGPLEPGK